MPHPFIDEVFVSVTPECIIKATVLSSVFNEVDAQYHYELQAEFSDGTNVVSVMLSDVAELIVTKKEEDF